MLNRSSEILTLIKLRNREGTIFHAMPQDIFKLMIGPGVPVINPETDIEKLLYQVAYGNLEQVKVILDKNPELLKHKGNVTAPSGDLIFHTFALTCAIGAGDYEMATLIKSYFPKISGGEDEAINQCAIYKDPVQIMLVQRYYNLSELMAILLNSSKRDVELALQCDIKHESKLNLALATFRKHFTSRVITEGMHFNYRDLLHAFSIYMQTFNKLLEKGGSDFTKIFEIQVIGYIQRKLPACLRQAFTQGIYYIVDEGQPLERSFQCRITDKKFPDTTDDNSLKGLGYTENGMMGAGMDVNGAEPFEKLIVETKIQLKQLLQQEVVKKNDCAIS